VDKCRTPRRLRENSAAHHDMDHDWRTHLATNWTFEPELWVRYTGGATPR
jgi:hypothetical protein